MFLTRNVMMKYRFPAGENDGGGDGGAAAAEAAAAKAATDAAAASAAEATAAAAAKGKSGPTDEEAKLIREVMDKKTKLKDAADEIAKLKDAVKQFDGLDIEAVRKMVAEKQAEATRKLEETGQWDSLKKQMVEEFGKEKGTLAALAAERETENASLKETIANLTVGNAFTASAYIKDDMTMPVNKVRALYASQFEFKDGGVVAYDKPAGSAERTVLVDAKGEPLGFEAAIAKIVEADPDRDQMLKSKIKTGAGSKSISKAVTPDQKLDQPSGVDRITAALNKGAFAKK